MEDFLRILGAQQTFFRNLNQTSIYRKPFTRRLHIDGYHSTPSTDLLLIGANSQILFRSKAFFLSPIEGGLPQVFYGQLFFGHRILHKSFYGQETFNMFSLKGIPSTRQKTYYTSSMNRAFPHGFFKRKRFHRSSLVIRPSMDLPQTDRYFVRSSID